MGKLNVYATQDEDRMYQFIPLARAILGNPNPPTTMLSALLQHCRFPDQMRGSVVAWAYSDETGLPVGWGMRTPRRLMVFVAEGVRKRRVGTVLVTEMFRAGAHLPSQPSVWTGTDAACRFWDRFVPHVAIGAFPEEG